MYIKYICICYYLHSLDISSYTMQCSRIDTFVNIIVQLKLKIVLTYSDIVSMCSVFSSWSYVIFLMDEW